MKAKTKSPIKDKPLRYVAQSADEAIDDLLNDKVLFYWSILVLFLVSIALLWLRYYLPTVGPPVWLTAILGCGCLYCGYRIVQHFRKLKPLKLGRTGERAVGQYLESLRESGAHVFHDILGDKFNVDHVVISNKGIYVIETKTYSKPAKGRPVINFDGDRVLINGKESKTDVITQAKAAASYIKKILKDSTGKEIETFPVVLFPGWFVEGAGNKKGKLWVLEPKAFRKFVDAQKVILQDEDVNLASYHLSRHIRNA